MKLWVGTLVLAVLITHYYDWFREVPSPIALVNQDPLHTDIERHTRALVQLSWELSHEIAQLVNIPWTTPHQVQPTCVPCAELADQLHQTWLEANQSSHLDYFEVVWRAEQLSREVLRRAQAPFLWGGEVLRPTYISPAAHQLATDLRHSLEEVRQLAKRQELSHHLQLLYGCWAEHRDCLMPVVMPNDVDSMQRLTKVGFRYAFASHQLIASQLGTTSTSLGTAACGRLIIGHFADAYHDHLGLARFGATWAAVAVACPNATRFLLGGGDLLAPLCIHCPAAGKAELLGRMGLDASVVGNHELDLGWEAADRVFQTNSSFLWILTNLQHNPLRHTRRHVVFATNAGIRVGIIGLWDQSILKLLPVEARARCEAMNCSVEEYVVVAQRECQYLRTREAVGFCICLTHMDRQSDVSLAMSNVCDVVFGGHDHSYSSVLNDWGSSLLKSGTDYSDLSLTHVLPPASASTHLLNGMVSRTMHGDLILFQRIQVSEPQTVCAFAKQQAAWSRCLATFRETYTKLETALHQVFGVANHSIICEWPERLPSWMVSSRYQSTLFGSLTNDIVLRNYYDHRTSSRPVVSHLSSGFFRWEGDMEKTLTEYVLSDMLKYSDQVVALRCPFHALWSDFEYAFSFLPRKEIGAFPQVGGMRVWIDSQRPPYQRMVAIELEDEQQSFPLTLATATKELTVLTRGYQADGGDGYIGMATVCRCEQQLAPESILQQVTRYLRDQAGPCQRGLSMGTLSNLLERVIHVK